MPAAQTQPPEDAHAIMRLRSLSKTLALRAHRVWLVMLTLFGFVVSELVNAALRWNGQASALLLAALGCVGIGLLALLYLHWRTQAARALAQAALIATRPRPELVEWEPNTSADYF